MPKVQVDGVEIELPQGAAALGRRRRGATGALAALAALAALGPAGQSASAQLAAGYSGNSSLSNIQGEEAYRILRAFGACYASRNSAGALALIATDPGTREEADTYRSLFRRDVQCLGSEENTEMRFPLPMVRGAIAEGLYRNRAALPANLALSAPAPGAPIRKLSEAARCYAATHRNEADTLVATTVPGSRREYELVSAMVPEFVRCLPETARGRRFLATQLRYSFAEALYRMPAAPAAVAAEPR
jgi:hypothetical protein